MFCISRTRFIDKHIVSVWIQSLKTESIDSFKAFANEPTVKGYLCPASSGACACALVCVRVYVYLSYLLLFPHREYCYYVCVCVDAVLHENLCFTLKSVFFFEKRYEFQRTKIFLRPLPKNCLFWIGLDLKGDRELNVRVEWFGCQYQSNDFFLQSLAAE